LKTIVYAGIDPGKTGACAYMSEDGATYDVFDWPGDEASAARKIKQLADNFEIRYCVLEAVSAFPGNGAVSMFNFGTNFGIWRGILATVGIPFSLIRPQKWQKGLILRNDGKDTKARSLTAARRLFPDAELHLKKHNGRADALLMAWHSKELFLK